MKKKAMPAAQARTARVRVAAKQAVMKKQAAGRGAAVGGKKGKVLSAQCSVPKRKRAKKREPFDLVMAAAKKRAAKMPGPEVVLENGQWETFAQGMALGAYSHKSCYMQAYPDSGPDAARSSAADLLAKPSIRARIAWLREESVKSVKVRIEEQLRWYLTVKDTPTGYVDAESPLCQEVNYDAETGAVTKVKIPSKMDASRQIDKLMGFEKKDDDPRDKAIDAMAEMVRMIREGRQA